MSRVGSSVSSSPLLRVKLPTLVASGALAPLSTCPPCSFHTFASLAILSVPMTVPSEHAVTRGFSNNREAMRTVVSRVEKRSERLFLVSVNSSVGGRASRTSLPSVCPMSSRCPDGQPTPVSPSFPARRSLDRCVRSGRTHRLRLERCERCPWRIDTERKRPKMVAKT